MHDHLQSIKVPLLIDHVLQRYKLQLSKKMNAYMLQPTTLKNQKNANLKTQQLHIELPPLKTLKLHNQNIKKLQSFLLIILYYSSYSHQTARIDRVLLSHEYESTLSISLGVGSLWLMSTVVWGSLRPVKSFASLIIPFLPVASSGFSLSKSCESIVVVSSYLNLTLIETVAVAAVNVLITTWETYYFIWLIIKSLIVLVPYCISP